MEKAEGRLAKAKGKLQKVRAQLSMPRVEVGALEDVVFQMEQDQQGDWLEAIFVQPGSIANDDVSQADEDSTDKGAGPAKNNKPKKNKK